MELVGARPALEAQPSLPLDASITLRTVISLSEGGLSEAARQMLAAIAVFPPKPNSFDEAAALAASDGEAPAWDALLDAGMVENMGAGRYALHPGVADYAAGLGGLAAGLRNQTVKFLHRRRRNGFQDYDIAFADDNELISRL